MIQVENLVKKYGNHLAVDHLNFTIEEGKIYGFLGPNGAGKSTTMNIMTGYLGATEGTVMINGHDILKEPEVAKKSIGYLPEIPPLYMEMTVLEYLEFAAELKKIPKAHRETQIENVMSMAKLNGVKDRLIQNLSKGYRQRVGLAQAILGFPEIIILDEPTVGLDPKQIIEIRELIRNLSKRHTVILSSHILAEVREVCDHIIIISNGKLVASDTPEKLEESIGRKGYIELETTEGEKEVRRILSSLDPIESIECTTSKEKNETITKAIVRVKGNLDIREQIFGAFAKNQKTLRTLAMTKNTLEDVFLELTQGNHVESIQDFEAESPKVESSKAETPKTESSKTELSKSDEEDPKKNYVNVEIPEINPEVNYDDLEGGYPEGGETHDSDL